MRLCSYVVKIDKGFVPNPFWGFCTCAACTPNHMGLKLKQGDWLIGNSSADTGEPRTLIYAMRISKVLKFDEYYRDPRFERKKARDGTWKDRCGDNIYYCDKAGRMVQATAFYHQSKKEIRKDLRNPQARVFVSNHFFYFGENAIEFPKDFASLVRIGRGCGYQDEDTAKKFVKWLERECSPGVHGLPRDREGNPSSECGASAQPSIKKRFARSKCQG